MQVYKFLKNIFTAKVDFLNSGGNIDFRNDIGDYAVFCNNCLSALRNHIFCSVQNNSAYKCSFHIKIPFLWKCSEKCKPENQRIFGFAMAP